MKSVKIVRAERGEDCTRGVMLVDGEIVCCTLELPWKENMRNVSAIPAGKYTVKPHKSPRFGNVFKLENVPGRSDILIHAGNTAKDTEGCILPGERFGAINGERAVISSTSALNALKRMCPDGFNLEIEDA